MRFECPYCGKQIREEANYCCGEAGHGQWVIEADDMKYMDKRMTAIEKKLSDLNDSVLSSLVDGRKHE